MKTEMVYNKRSELFTTTVQVAKRLEVTHTKLLRTVEKLFESSDEGWTGQSIVKFKVSGAKYIKGTFVAAKNNKYKMYEMNEQGFSLLVMQLGKYKKAMEIHNLFIKAFFQMKEALLNQQNNSWIEKRDQLKITRKEETDTIKDFIEYATAQGSKNAKMYYMNITKMTNKALELLIETPDGGKLRELANITQLGFIQIADYRAMQAIQEGMDRKFPYKEVYRLAKERVNSFIDLLSLS